MAVAFHAKEMRVVLTRKYATQIDGIDLSNCEVGNVIRLPERQARLLIAEEWAIPERGAVGPENVLAFRCAPDIDHSDGHVQMSHAS